MKLLRNTQILSAGLFLCALSCFGQYKLVKKLPAWSWKTVPLYQMFGHDSRMMVDSEVETIAKTTGFICIEKQHGKRALGSADEGAKVEIAKFKALDRSIKALAYFNSAYAWTNLSFMKDFKYGRIPDELKPFVLLDPETGELAHRDRIYRLDVMNPDFRQWWADRAGELVKYAGADGLFVDQMHAHAYCRAKGVSRKKVALAQADMMARAKIAIGKDNILLLNNAVAKPELFELADGFMFEHYSADKMAPKVIIHDWEMMKKAALAGKFTVWRIAPDRTGTELEGLKRNDAHHKRVADFEAHAKEELDYYLACFLMGMQPYSYFQYGWGWGLETGPLTDFPQLKKKIGRPKSDYRVDPKNEWNFGRQFEHLTVTVNLKTKESIFRWKE